MVMVVAAALMTVGVLMVATAGASTDRALFDPGVWSTPFGRQLIFVGFALVIMPLAVRFTTRVLTSERWTRRLVWLGLGAAVVSLLAVFIPGALDPHKGDHRWLRFSVGGIAMGYQPSEVAKLALIGTLAWMLCGPNGNPQSLRRGFIPAAVILGLLVGLVGSEDFGTSIILAGVGGAMMLAAGCRMTHLLSVALAGGVGMLGLLLAAPYRWERITAFQDIWNVAHPGSYQPRQSLTTIAEGGWWGRGLGGGIQKYGYLPESHTDFVFGVVCEELGLFGAMVVIGLFISMILLGLRAMMRAATPFERLVAFGLTASIGLQAALNMCVVTVLTPTTGISLPFVSAGGSNLVIYAVAVGALAAIERRGKMVDAESVPIEIAVPGAAAIA